MDIFDLFAKITLDSSEYEKGLGEAEKSTNSFGDKLRNGLGTAAKVGVGAIGAVAAGATAMVGAVIKGANETANYGDNIDKMSQKLGLSKQAYQEWDYVLGQSGTSIDSMQTGLKTLTNKLDDAKNGGADAQEMFAKLGISMDELSTMSREDLFSATIKGFQGMADSTERAALANDLFGRSGQELTPLFNTSAESTEELIDAAHRLGFVMSDEAVKASADYNDALDTLQRTFGGLKRSLTGEFMPSITTIMEGLSEVFGGDSTKGIAMISDGIDTLVQNITDKLPQFMDLAVQIVMSLGQAIIDNLPQLLEAAGEIVGKLIAGIIEALPKIIAMAPQIIKAVVKGLVSAWPELKKAGVQLITVIKDAAMSVINRAGEWGRSLVDKIKIGFTNAFGGFFSTVSQSFDSIRQKISNIFDSAREIVRNAIDRIKGLFNFEWKLPKLKMPHFSWTWKDVGGILKLPNISVSWYKKAYENPYLFTEPTVMNGKGFGDGGGSGEIVYGRDQLMRDIAQATKGDITINVYASDGMDINELADKIERRLTQLQKRRSAVYA